MPDECAIGFDNVQVTPHKLLSDPITSLSGPRMHEVCKALAIATGCD